MADRADGETGFALVDVLVGIAVAGLAGSILAGLVAFIGNQRSEATRRMREYEDTFAVDRIVRGLVAGAPAFMPKAQPLSAIFGTEREMAITSTGLPILGLPQLSVFVLKQESRGSVSDVILRWRDAGGNERREIVVRSISDLSFAYRPRSAGRAAPNWHSRWRAEDGSLSALRLTFRLSPASAVRVIEIPVHANFPASCLRNPRHVGCSMEER